MKKITLLIILSIGVLTAQTYSYKTHGNVANFFASAQEELTFFHFKNGDVIAEIGAANGENVGGFAFLTDSCTFYIQDIDSKVLNHTAWNKVYSKCKKLGASVKHQFNIIIGDEKSTHLPEASLDKIIMVSSFHEFSFMSEMIADIKSRLKPNGEVYILETHCYAKGHKYYTMDEAVSLMEKNGFKLTSSSNKDRNGSDGLYILSFRK